MPTTEVYKYKITWKEFDDLCIELSKKIKEEYDYIFPIPKNGLFIAERISKILNISIEHEIQFDKNILVVDDLIDSGKTIQQYGDFDTAVLFVKNKNIELANYFVEEKQDWIVFPWEKEDDIYDAIIRQLEYIGENPNREGLIDTPKRIVKSWNELYSGYKQNPEDIMTTFEDGACDEMVVLKNVNFFSVCEHHNLPFFGKCYIGYIPNKKVIGLSKLARLVEIYARRMQIQEKMTSQIADCLMKYLDPLGVMVLVEAKHLCMISRGVKSQDAIMTTSAIRGVFKDNTNNARTEFLNLINRR